MKETSDWWRKQNQSDQDPLVSSGDDTPPCGRKITEPSEITKKQMVNTKNNEIGLITNGPVFCLIYDCCDSGRALHQTLNLISNFWDNPSRPSYVISSRGIYVNRHDWPFPVYPLQLWQFLLSLWQSEYYNNAICHVSDLIVKHGRSQFLLSWTNW